jgi:hypothetical protein
MLLLNSSCFPERGLNARVAMEQLCELHPEGPRLTHRPPDWPFFTRLELGKFLYTLIIRNIFVWHPINTEKLASSYLASFSTLAFFLVCNFVVSHLIQCLCSDCRCYKFNDNFCISSISL